MQQGSVQRFLIRFIHQSGMFQVYTPLITNQNLIVLPAMGNEVNTNTYVQFISKYLLLADELNNKNKLDVWSIKSIRFLF